MAKTKNSASMEKRPLTEDKKKKKNLKKKCKKKKPDKPLNEYNFDF